MRRIDLNADVGESFGAYTLGHDDAVMRHITSANVACGFHAGDPSVMRDTVRLAVAAGVGIGAHPGFPDLNGFGRRKMEMSERQIEDLVAYQIGALAGVAAAEVARLHHVKPHGALYNMAAKDRRLADAIALADAEFGQWPDSPDYFYVLGDVLFDQAVADPAQAVHHWLPMAQGAWERCLTIGERPDLDGSVTGRGSYLAQQSLDIVRSQLATLAA